MRNGAGYRADIDGLRSVAVLPVLLFHAGVPGFSGGYVGVDIFFVISGFLITGIIAREIDQGRFSIVHFYERRARRILPALMVVIAAILLAATWLYLPGDFESVPRSALAALLFVSNVGFFLETGYFQGGAETKPLLHTWSLAIEEQFYLTFPLLLILLGRHAMRWRAAVIAGLALLSFAWALATQKNGDGFAFYLLPPRAWELAIGALLALGAVPSVTAGRLREALGVAGFLAIGVAVFLYDKHTIFPGLTAVLPVFGAAALIHCAPGTRMGRLLSLRPLVAVGLISYSLYLWHWPLIVFTEYATDQRLTGWSSAIVIAAAFALALLSWRYVEKPFRDPSRIRRAPLFRLAAIAMAALCAVSLGLIAAGPWPGRFDSRVIAMAEAKNDVSPYRGRCHDSSSAGLPACVLGAAAPPSTMVWGDSHAVELAYVLSRIEAQHGRSLVQYSQSSCPPIAGYDPPGDPRCGKANREALAAIRSDPRLGTIYLAAFWASPANSSDAVLAGLDRTVGQLVGEGRRVVIVGPVPPAPFEVPRRLAHLAAFGRVDEAFNPLGPDIRNAATRVEAVARRWRRAGAAYIDPVAALCNGGRCLLLHDGQPLYFDSHHPSRAGIRFILARQPGNSWTLPPVRR
nr:acyltransferase family protein [Sphingomonas sp. Y57]